MQLVIDIQADIVVQEQLVLSQASQHVTLLSSSGNTLSGGGRKRILYISDRTKVTAHNLIFRDGDSTNETDSQSGGAVLVVGDGIFEAFQCLFTNNHGTNGGAIAALGNTVSLEASIFYNNSAIDGGVLYSVGWQQWQAAGFACSRCRFENNTATRHSAINSPDYLKLTDTHFAKNIYSDSSSYEVNAPLLNSARPSSCNNHSEGIAMTDHCLELTTHDCKPIQNCPVSVPLSLSLYNVVLTGLTLPV